MRKIFFFCWCYISECKWPLLIYIVISVIVSASSLASPYIIGDFIDQLTIADNLSFIFNYFTLYAGISFATLILGYVSGRLYIRLQTRLGYDINRDFIKKLQRAPLSFTSSQNTAYLNQRINNDSNSLIIFCISIIQSVIVNAVILAVTLSLMFSFHARLSFILMGLTFVYLVFYVLYKKTLFKANHTYQESQSNFFAKLNEQMFNIRFIKLHSLFSSFIERLNYGYNKLLKSALQYQRVNYVYNALDQLVVIIAQMVLLLLGGIEIMSGRLSVGRYIIISGYFNMLLGAIRYFFSLGQNIQNKMVSYSRLKELSSVKPEPNGDVKINEVHTIETRGLSFSYGEKTIFKNINLTFTKGQIYTVLGPNGSGKSTLADILLGLQGDNYMGYILYNGIKTNDLDMYDIRHRFVGVSEQEPTLITDTINNNLNLNNIDHLQTKNEMVDKLMGILGLSSFIYSLTGQFETVINEGANNTSGGEKQKLSILRALLKDPDVIILDEPTSALDNESKLSLRAYLNEIKHNKIIIIITHDAEFIDFENDNIISTTTENLWAHENEIITQMCE